jgi:hypothetical protein
MGRVEIYFYGNKICRHGELVMEINKLTRHVRVASKLQNKSYLKILKN